MRNNKNRSSSYLFRIGILLLCGSLLFFVYTRIQLGQEKQKAIALEEQFQEKIDQETAKEVVEPLPSYGKEADEPLLPSAIGVLRIDEIGVISPIFDNTRSKSLLEGVGIVETTDFPSDAQNTITVLAGHRGGRKEELSFLHIDQLQEGSEVKITTEKEILYYKVVGQEVIEPTDWSKFTREEGQTKLYLMACHPYPKNDKRLLVKAQLVNTLVNKG